MPDDDALYCSAFQRAVSVSSVSWPDRHNALAICKGLRIHWGAGGETQIDWCRVHPCRLSVCGCQQIWVYAAQGVALSRTYNFNWSHNFIRNSLRADSAGCQLPVVNLKTSCKSDLALQASLKLFDAGQNKCISYERREAESEWQRTREEWRRTLERCTRNALDMPQATHLRARFIGLAGSI